MNRLTSWIINYPKWVVLACVVLTLGVTLFAKDAPFTSDFRVYFSKDNPQMMAFEALEADFNKQDNLLLLVDTEAPVFTESNLRLLRDIVAKSWQLPYVRRVDSVVNFPRSSMVNDEMSSDDIVGDNFEFTPSALNEAQTFVLNDKTASRFLSADGHLTAVMLTLTLPDNDADATRNAVVNARNMIAALNLPDSVNVMMSGTAAVNLALEEAVERDLPVLIPLSYVLIVVVMYLLLRSFSGVLLTLVVITLSTLSIFGIFVGLGGVLTPGVSSVPNMVMIIAVADCMHLLLSYYHYLGNDEKKVALMKALAINFKPMFITSLTTAIGLLCLNFSESPPYRDLGNLVAMGAVVAFVLSITFLPACLILLPIPKRLRNQGGKALWHEALMTRFGVFVTANYKVLMVVSSVLVIATVANLHRAQFNDRWVDYYDDTYPIKQAINKMDARLDGIRFIDFKVDARETHGIYQQQFMNDLDRLVVWLREQPEVRRVRSFSDQVRFINQLLHNQNPEFYKIPDNNELLAQSVLMYELSLPYGMGLDEQMNIDKSALRISVVLQEMDSQQIIDLEQRISAWAVANTPHLTLNEGTGLDIVFAHISQRNIASLMMGTLIALVLISLILIVVLKSWKLGLISLIPNVVPAAMAYGIWVIKVGNIDLATSLVAAMSLGLVVDDTVHFLAKYQRARNEEGMSTKAAIEYAFSTVGVAMLVTSLVLAVGFGILVLSHFAPIWGLGFMLSLTIIFALVVDFLLLPGLLLLFDRDDVGKSAAAVKPAIN